MNDELLFKEIKKTQDPTLFRIFLDKWEDEVYRYALVATGKKEDEALDLATKIF